MYVLCGTALSLHSALWYHLLLYVSTEFTKVAFRTAIGFVVMGFIGFFVKLIFIPINNIIVGS